MELQEAIIHAREVSKRCRLDNQECAYQHDKLADWMEELKNIKNILGTEYDLERLKELVEADREGRIKIDKKESRKEDLYPKCFGNFDSNSSKCRDRCAFIEYCLSYFR